MLPCQVLVFCFLLWEVMLEGVFWWERDGEGLVLGGASCSRGVESLLPRMFVVVGGDVGWESDGEGLF